jgi:hypothetical protein
VLAAAVAMVVTACGGSGSAGTTTIDTAVRTTTPLRVDEIAAAVKAVENTQGAAARFTEINAIDGGVNVFVATGDGQEISYFFHDGTLDPAGQPQTASGPAFALDQAELDAPQRLIPALQQQFPGDEVTTVALLVLPEEGLSWALRLRSTQGGVLEVIYTPQGQLLTVQPE